MWSISRSKIDKKIGCDSYVPLWSFVQELSPVFSRKAVKSLPSAHSLFGNTKIRSKLLPPPRPYDFSIAVHESHYGESLQFCQGEILQCFLWINRPHFTL